MARYKGFLPDPANAVFVSLSEDNGKNGGSKQISGAAQRF